MGELLKNFLLDCYISFVVYSGSAQLSQALGA